MMKSKGGVERYLPLICLAFFFLDPCIGCPAKIVDLCECDLWLSGLQLFCSAQNLTEVTDVLKELNSPIQQLVLRDYDVPRVEAHAFKGISITHLQLINNSIAEIDKDAFVGLDMLESLIIHYNDLQTMPSLHDLPALLRLDLSNNSLRDIPPKAFLPAPKLRELKLQNNSICTFSSLNSLNETRPSLELLDLSGNCFLTVPVRNLESFPKLTYVDLSRNKIGFLPPHQFLHLSSLRELRLGHNRFAAISQNSFLQVPNLAHLYLQGNQLSRLEPQFYTSFPKLEFIHLGDNNINEIATGSFIEHPSLQQIILAGNSIETVEKAAFSSNPKLRAISISDNKLKRLDDHAFDSLPNMTYLTLANNVLENAGPRMFDGMPGLQYLNLRNNNIVELEPKTFSNLQGLTTIDLANNNLTTVPVDSFKGLKKLFWVDFSQNQMEGFSKGTFVDKVTNMLLEGNQLNCSDELDWFVGYLSRFNVRTRLPDEEEEIVCSSPKKFEGVKLSEYMFKKMNITLYEKMSEIIPGTKGGANKSPLGTLLPGLGKIPALDKGLSGLANPLGLNLMSKIIPGLDAIPGLQAFTNPNFFGKGASDAMKGFAAPLKDFAAPLSKMVSGRGMGAQDLNNMVESIPSMLKSMPTKVSGTGIPGLDLSKIPLATMAHVLEGGQIPGISKPVLDDMVKLYFREMAAAAKAANEGKKTTESGTPVTNYLLPAASLPTKLVQQVLNGENLPGLSAKETSYIHKYYADSVKMDSLPLNGHITPNQLLHLMSKQGKLADLPEDILQRVSKGESIPLASIPKDILKSILEENPQLAQQVKDFLSSSDSQSGMPTLPPHRISRKEYDLRKVDQNADVKDPSANDSSDPNIPIYTGIGLGIVALVSVATVFMLCWRLKRSKSTSSSETESGTTEDYESYVDSVVIDYSPPPPLPVFSNNNQHKNSPLPPSTHTMPLSPPADMLNGSMSRTSSRVPPGVPRQSLDGSGIDF